MAGLAKSKRSGRSNTYSPSAITRNFEIGSILFKRFEIGSSQPCQGRLVEAHLLLDVSLDFVSALDTMPCNSGQSRRYCSQPTSRIAV